MWNSEIINPEEVMSEMRTKAQHYGQESTRIQVQKILDRQRSKMDSDILEMKDLKDIEPV